MIVGAPSRPSSYTRVKVCGVTRPEDARVACAAGVDAIGLVFWSGSKRYVSLEQAAEICRVLDPFTTVTALMVNASEHQVREILDAVPVNLLQWHGDETPDFCEQWRRPYIRALAVTPSTDLRVEMARYPSARGFLLDAVHQGQFGGTGTRFDWDQVQGKLPGPIVLAGGLNADNVAEGMARLRPMAVDVSSGVESAPGVKDPAKIKRFVEAVRRADEEITV